MDQPLSSIEIFRQLIDSDLKTDLATASLLKQYKNYLLAAQYRGITMSTSIPRILLYLSTIQKFQIEKIRLYQTLSRRNFHKCISNQLLEDLEKIGSQVEDTLESMKDLLPNVVPFKTSSVRIYFDDLVQTLSNKKFFFITVPNLPAEPWISPYVKQLYRS